MTRFRDAVVLVLVTTATVHADCGPEEVARLLAGDGATGDELGIDTSIDDGHAIAGAPGDDNGLSGSGSAYLFERTIDDWAPRLRLTASDALMFDAFGSAVSIDAPWAAVGAPGRDAGGNGAGAVYVFHRDAGGPDAWGEVAILTAPAPEAGDAFGGSVAISGTTIVVGANGAGVGGTAFVFRHQDGAWIDAGALAPADAAAGQAFATSVAVDGAVIVAGAPGDGEAGSGAGAAYVFVEPGARRGSWTQAAKLVGADTTDGDALGASVSVSVSTALVGAAGHDGPGIDRGAAYVFRRDAGGPGLWGEAAKLVALDVRDDDQFGIDVAIRGNSAIVGAWLSDDDGPKSGSAYVFTRQVGSGDSWLLQSEVRASDAEASDRFGQTVAAGARYGIVAAPGNDEGGGDTGAVYVYALPQTPCTADLDGSGTVDVDDVLLLLQRWGPCEDCIEDLNGNGAVDVADIVQLLVSWGSCTGGGPLGACCVGNGICAVTTEVGCVQACGGAWAEGADCADDDGDGVPSAFELGDCSAASGCTAGTDPDDPDTDGDGISDGDELLGTVDGLDLPALGADPLVPDIFVEVDWMDDGSHTHRPTDSSMDLVVEAFAASPVPGPCGTTGIAMHVDYGQGGPFFGGNFIGTDTVVVFDGEFNDYKAQHFDVRRKGVFHYAIFCHRYNSANNSSSGVAELPGDDFVVSLQSFLSDSNVSKTFLHELGHNLLLRHGGFENRNYKPNYNSVMNYRYQFQGADVTCDARGDGVLDYSYGERLDLDELALDEVDGVCGTRFIDWNGSGLPDPPPLEYNINCPAGLSAPCGSQPGACADSVCTLLRDSDDWGRMILPIPIGTDAPREIIECQDVPATAP